MYYHLLSLTNVTRIGAVIKKPLDRYHNKHIF